MPSPRIILAALIVTLIAMTGAWIARGHWDAGQQAKAIAAAQERFQKADAARQAIADQRNRMVRDVVRQNAALPVVVKKCLSPARVNLLDAVK